MRLVDLTHTVAEPMPTYPGDPPTRLRPFATLENGCPMYHLETGLHAGTHLDAPLHFIPGGATVAELPLERCTGRGVLLDARQHPRIDTTLLDGIQLHPGDAVLVLTGWSERFRDPRYYHDFPAITAEFAQRLIDSQVHLLGLDTPSPDRAPYPLHPILLGAGILLLENLTNLDQLLPHPNFQILAFPLKLAAEAAPCRVVASIS